MYSELHHIHRSEELKALDEVKLQQDEVGRQVARNLNVSFRAFDQYRSLLTRYERAEEDTIKAYDGLQHAIDQGKQQVGTVFKMICEKLSFLVEAQQWLMAQVFDFRSFLFYLAFGIGIFVVTSFERTLAVRFPLLLIAVGNYFAETALVKTLSAPGSRLGRLFCDGQCLNADITGILGYERFAFLLLCAGIFFYRMATYQNYQAENNRILEELKRKLRYVERTPYWVHKYFSRRVQGRAIDYDPKPIKPSRHHGAEDKKTSPIKEDAEETDAGYDMGSTKK